MELYAKRAKTIDLRIDDGVGQTELGNAVFEYAAYLVERLEDMHFVAVFGGITGESETGGTTTNYGDFIACWFIYDFVIYDLAIYLVIWPFGHLTVGIICAETLEVADGDGGMAHLEMDAVGLALFLLRADTTADSRQG